MGEARRTPDGRAGLMGAWQGVMRAPLSGKGSGFRRIVVVNLIVIKNSLIRPKRKVIYLSTTKHRREGSVFRRLGEAGRGLPPHRSGKSSMHGSDGRSGARTAATPSPRDLQAADHAGSGVVDVRVAGFRCRDG